MDIHQARDRIEQMVAEIGKCRREIEAKGKERAAAIKHYDMKLAIALATLRNAELYELGGKTYKSPPVSIAEKIAKGICFQEKLNSDLADTTYKSTIVKIETVQAELNAYQSLYKSQIEI